MHLYNKCVIFCEFDMMPCYIDSLMFLQNTFFSGEEEEN